ncbi:MAG TPA: hypothetical protein VGN81_15945 [Pseudonocardiaceae bacterium]
MNPTDAARAVALDAANAYRDAFADRLTAAYALGSVAHGGYAAAVSDIDLGLVLAEIQDGDAALVESTREALLERGPLYRKLSVFWASLPALRQGRSDGRFPAIDRLDLHDNGALLLGDEVAAQATVATAEELLLDSARFAITLLASDAVIAECHQPSRLLTDSVYFTKAVLFPVRFLFSTKKTDGRAATNDEAIDWYLAQPEPVAADLVRLAAEVRRGAPLDTNQATRLLAAGLIPLYQHYIDELTPRLPTDLADAFTQWGKQLA